MKDYLNDSENYKKRLEQIDNSKEQISNTLKNHYKNPIFYYNYLLSRLNSEYFKNITKEYVERKFKEKFPEENFPPIDNHIITSIEYVGEEDVYDMEVEKYHNFSTNNIFVHNSQEVEENKPFIGKAGNILWDTMADFDLKRSDFLIINSVNCRPVDGNKNGKPTKEQMDICYPWIRKYLKVLDPEKILTLGNYALWSMFKQEGISKRNGEIERLYEFNVNAYKSVHPAFCIYNREEGIEKLRYSIESFKEDIPF
jgi:uracil-DNA glycosylase family 4